MKITDNCHAVIGLGYYPPWTVNAGIITGNSQTLIIDTGPNFTSAQTIYDFAEVYRPGNELLIINTEKHFDHIGGNSFFKEKGFKIYGHEEINRSEREFNGEIEYYHNSILDVKRKQLNEEQFFFKNTRIVNPDNHISNNQIFLEGEKSEARILFTPGHTETNISIYVPAQRILYCGDCIVNGYYPNLESGIKTDWEKWLNSLAIISGLELNYVIPGHGNLLKGAEIGWEIIRIREILEKTVKNGK